MATVQTDKNMRFKTKTINWSDSYGNFHMNNILLQNRNGPCFIISFINTLILAKELDELDEWSTVALKSKKGVATPLSTKSGVKKLKNSDLTPLKEILLREEVSFDSILNELTSLMLLLNTDGSEIVDIAEILNILPYLDSGLNVNLKLSNPIIEDFEEQTDSINSLLKLFELKITHGFVFDDAQMVEDPELDSFDKCQDYLISIIDLFQSKYDINLQTSDSEQLSTLSVDDESDQKRLIKYLKLKEFLDENKTQLTKTGLNILQTNDLILSNDSFLIFFRNDHFNTIYKVNGQLYLLANDEGYRNNDEIVWEELKSIGGLKDELLTGSFKTPQLKNEEVMGPSSADVMLAKQLQSQEDEDYAKKLQKSYQQKAAAAATPTSTNKKRKHKSKEKGVATTSTNTDTTPPTKTKSDSCVIM
ncbi:hypothetical protein CANARDRAFT_238283 [[Candida] arabinofermentans NRRL YB-2248]|uniref:MINDY deubiquitinase domain-containing protein n=1 Tax=[Candida] arabinofermentans NRRL YB-2248 TaxID=983967 RepID=A0A1E4SVB1_9ASCO|nr:hypothetical protein CANARDRAFT_238283 [[Candida] arabinofermentans NRRL YB-2248]